MNSDKIVIRKMTQDDISFVVELGYVCFDQRKTVNRFWTPDVPRLAFVTDPDHCFVAVHDTKLVGFSIGAGHLGNDTSLGHIRWTAVHSDYRTLGLGTSLFVTNARSMFAKQKVRVLTDIEADNFASETMVKRVGFQIDFTLNYWFVSNEEFSDTEFR